MTRSTAGGGRQKERPRFEIGREHIHEFNQQLGALVDESKLHFEEDGLSSKAVDPANVGMIDVTLGSEAFDFYQGDGEVIGYPLINLRDILGKEADVQAEFAVQDDGRKMDISLGIADITMSYVHPDNLRNEPDIPELDLTTEVLIQVEELEKIVTYADAVTDRLRFGFDHHEWQFYAEAQGDTNDFEYRPSTSEIVDVSSSGNADSLFSLDYLKKAVEAVPEGTIVELHLGEEFPLKMRYDFGPGGNGRVEYMQAPRIQSD